MRHYLPGEKPFESFPTFDSRYKHLWVGIVRRYDQDNETCDVEWISYNGGRPATGVTLAVSGPRTYMGGPPEEGAYVYCDWVPQIASGTYQPVIVGYAPTGYAVGRKFYKIKSPWDEYYQRPGKRFKTPKLYPGDLAMVSSAGSQVIADENLLLSGAGLTETLHRSSDLAIISMALQHYTEGAGSRVRWGMVERDPNFISGATPQNEPLGEDGSIHHYVTSGVDANRLEDGASAWVEYRVELRETSQGNLVVPETVHGKGANLVEESFLRQVSGTLVGNQVSSRNLYGKPLVRLVISGGAISRSYQAASSSSEETQAASAFHLSLGASEMSPVASVDLDKSGRLALSLGATPGGHPADPGKSLQIAADGSLEAVFSGDPAILLSADGNVELTSTQDVTVLANGDMELQAAGTATLDGSLVYLGAGGAGSGRPC